MATSKKGPARNIPAHGVDAQVLVVDTSSAGAPEDLKWATLVDVAQLPDQSGKSGKFLTTNGTVTSWGTPPDVDDAPDVTYTPTTAADWGTHVPTTVQGALDVIASMITIT